MRQKGLKCLHFFGSVTFSTGRSRGRQNRLKKGKCLMRFEGKVVIVLVQNTP